MAKWTLERIALASEILGGVAVVVSVIYLAIQLSDNNRLLRSQAHYNALDVLQRPIELLVGNEALAQKVSRCDVAEAELPIEVVAQCDSYYFMQFNGWEYAYYQIKDNSIPQELWAGVDASFRNGIEKKPGYEKFWKQFQLAYGEPFRTYVETAFGE